MFSNLISRNWSQVDQLNVSSVCRMHSHFTADVFAQMVIRFNKTVFNCLGGSMSSAFRSLWVRFLLAIVVLGVSGTLSRKAARANLPVW